MDQFVCGMYGRCKAGLNCCYFCVNEAVEYRLLIKYEISDNEISDEDDIAGDSNDIVGDSGYNDDFFRA